MRQYNDTAKFMNLFDNRNCFFPAFHIAFSRHKFKNHFLLNKLLLDWVTVILKNFLPGHFHSLLVQKINQLTVTVDLTVNRKFI